MVRKESKYIIGWGLSFGYLYQYLSIFVNKVSILGKYELKLEHWCLFVLHCTYICGHSLSRISISLRLLTHTHFRGATFWTWPNWNVNGTVVTGTSNTGCSPLRETRGPHSEFGILHVFLNFFFFENSSRMVEIKRHIAKRVNYSLISIWICRTLYTEVFHLTYPLFEHHD